MKIFITGASGFIGGAIAKQLKEKHEIYAMARSEGSAEKIRQLGATPVQCSLKHVKKEDLHNCDLIVHAAAYVEAWGTRQQYWEINVEGTQQLTEVAKEAGVKKFIHISSEATLFYGQPMDNIDETYPYPKRTPYLYSETKAEAEKIVIAANLPGVFETISIRPRMVWGPGDRTVLPEVKKMIAAGSFMWVNNGAALTSTTHIYNLVKGVELAIEKGKGGEIYFITDDEIVTFKKFLTDMLATQNIVPPNKSIPGWLLSFMAYVIEKTWRLFGIKKEPPITRFAADIIAVNCTINIGKAKRELGYKPVISIAEGMEEMKNIKD
ncbi:MAG TPA: NAD-dependent epimerase/dehydratase family protein [Bacteroidetes bacterium]|nr:NAD-dependent epimerase/dehydratase family protein [Bacteroidota bacterium]